MSGERCEFMQYHRGHDYRNDRGEPRQCGGLHAPRDVNAGAERIAVAVEAQIRHLLAVPSDVTDVPRDAMANDLQLLADDIRRGRYAATP